MQVVWHILLESSLWGLQLCFRSHLNRRFKEEVMSLQSHRNPNFKNFETPTWECQDKMTFGCWPVARHKKCYKGGRWWLPPNPGCVESCESMFAHGSSVHQECSNYALTNLLFGLCRSMWIINLLFTPPSPHPGTWTRPSTPKVLRTKERAPTLYPLAIFTFRLAFESTKEFGGASVRQRLG